MSIADISSDSVLHAIQSGKNTRAELGDVFSVLPTSHFLEDAISDLKNHGRIVEHDGGELHVNDLMEQIPHDPEEPK